MSLLDDCVEEWGDTERGGRFVDPATILIGMGCLGSFMAPPGLVNFAHRDNPPFVSEFENQDWQQKPGVFNSELDIESHDDELPPFHLQLVQLHLKSQLENLSLPRAWIQDGTEEPSPDCLKWSLQVLCRLFDNYGLIPYKIVPSKEGGVFAAFKNPLNANILRVEVDNELDVVAVVSDGQCILESGLLEDDDLERSLIECFDPRLA